MLYSISKSHGIISCNRLYKFTGILLKNYENNIIQIVCMNSTTQLSSSLPPLKLQPETMLKTSTTTNHLDIDNKPSYGSATTRLRMFVPSSELYIRHCEGVGSGNVGRLMQLRRYVSKLIDVERIELSWVHATEARLYTERLIQETIIASQKQDLILLWNEWIKSDQNNHVNQFNLDTNILELTLFWLSEPRLIEKLFKVFVPRYRHYNRAFTSLYRLQIPNDPDTFQKHKYGHGILELHGNPWPPVNGHGLPGYGLNPEPYKHHYLINVLVSAARKSGQTISKTINQKDSS